MLNIRIQTGYSFVKNSLFLLFIVAAIACSNKRRIEETVSEMLHHSIVLPVEDMISLQKDNKRHFKKKNPHIPKDDPYHVLLIDKSDKIVLVGNPIANPKIEKMLFDIIN